MPWMSSLDKQKFLGFRKQVLGICLACDTSGHQCQGTTALGSPSLLQSREWCLTSDSQEQPRKPAPGPLPRRTPEATGHMCDLEDRLLPFRASVFLVWRMRTTLAPLHGT